MSKLIKSLIALAVLSVVVVGTLIFSERIKSKLVRALSDKHTQIVPTVDSPRIASSARRELSSRPMHFKRSKKARRHSRHAKHSRKHGHRLAKHRKHHRTTASSENVLDFSK